MFCNPAMENKRMIRDTNSGYICILRCLGYLSYLCGNIVLNNGLEVGALQMLCSHLYK
ncbi:unnamed protein product [Camellia sinensis]